MREHNLPAEDIDTVTVFVGKSFMELLCEPLDAKQNPSGVVDAQFSIPWAVASAIARKKVGIAEFTPDAIKDKRILTLSNVVTPKHDESLDRLGVGPAIVEIRTKEGKVWSERVDTPYGSPENPMNMEAIASKLRDCAIFAAKPVSQKNLDGVLQMVKHIETVKDVGQIVRLLLG
jgi:2-methylcitrate dehydratase PrpD